MGLAFVFHRQLGSACTGLDPIPASRGHVGWGIQVDDSTYVYGGFDRHAPGTSLLARTALGWLARGSHVQMLADMRAASYEDYRTLSVERPDAVLGREEALRRVTPGYQAFGKDCLDATWRVIDAYRGRPYVPQPPFLSVPHDANVWFAEIPGVQHSL